MTRKRLYAVVLILMVASLSLSLVTGPGVPPAQADGGAYTIDLSAADPEDYIPPVPFPGVVTPIIGRGHGDVPIPHARYADDTGTQVNLESLEPRLMALCQIVPYEVGIVAGSGVEAIDEPITFRISFATATTSNDQFGFDETEGIIAAFVDIDDGQYTDANSDATVSYFDWTYEPGIDKGVIMGTFEVSGLDAGDEVVVEIWPVLDCTIPPKATGNVPVKAVDASTAADDAIGLGTQNVPLNQVGLFEAVAVDLSVVKDDDDLWKAVNEPFEYTLIVSREDTTTHIANDVLVVDTLDPWLEYLSDDDPLVYPYTISPQLPYPYERDCTWMDDDMDGLGGTLTCDLGPMVEAEAVTINFWVMAVPGVPLGSLCEGADELNPATDCETECPPTYLSPTGCDVCNRVSVSTISDDTNPDNNWDEEPKDIRYPTPVTLHSFTATGLPGAIQLDWTTTSEVDNLGFNLYRAPSLNAKRTKLNDELIPGQGPGSLEGDSYQYVDTTAPGMTTYYYWLEDVDIYFYTELHGPVSAQRLK